jgi:Protein of unknown function (DUF4087)
MRYLLLLLIFTTFPTSAAERRCGWLANPTPANWWLTDRQGEWIISTQGGGEADGMDRIPDFPDRLWIKTNGYHGYGCACMTVNTDRKTKRITNIMSATPRPLKQCRADRRLTKR